MNSKWIMCIIFFDTIFGILTTSFAEKLLPYWEYRDCMRYLNYLDNHHNHDLVVVCCMRSENEIKNIFNYTKTQQMVQLRLTCDDFEKLEKLEKLEEALKDLKQFGNLTVKTFNEEFAAMTFKISPNIFNDELRTLKHLDLGENNIWELPKEIFCPLHSLESVNLTQNFIADVSFFKYANDTKRCGETIKIIDLSDNRIHKVHPGEISGLSNLQELYLQRNMIGSFVYVFDPSVLDGLSSLKILDLSYNHIKYLPSGLFSDTKELTELYLQNNRIYEDSPRLFNRLDKIQVLNLSQNQLHSGWIKEAFTGLVSLVVLDLSYNKIRVIEESVLRDLCNLQILHLHHNEINYISENTFEKLINLHTLDLSANRFHNIQENSFKNLYALSVLNLESNQIDYIPENTFFNLTNLHTLKLSSNLFEKIQGDTFKRLCALSILDLGNNKINYIDPKILNNLTNLKMLFLNENHLTSFPYGIPNSIQILDLGNNKITSIDSYIFTNKPNLTKVDFSGNQITHLDENSLRISKVPPEKNLPEFQIGNNPYICDCTMGWLQKVNGENSRTYPKLINTEDIYCDVINIRGVSSHSPLMKVKPHQFICPYKSKCKFRSEDYNYFENCPEKCICFHDQTRSENIFDCSSKNHLNLPHKIHENVTELCLDGNFLQLNSDALIGKEKLKYLFLNASGINIIENGTFYGLNNLEVLCLDRNKLTELKGYEFENLIKLKEIYLQYNYLKSILNSTFAHLKLLKVLRLDHNKLMEFNFWDLPISLIEITLAENPLNCDCDYSEKLREWMIRSDVVLDFNEVSCLNNARNLIYEGGFFRELAMHSGFYISKIDQICMHFRKQRLNNVKI